MPRPTAPPDSEFPALAPSSYVVLGLIAQHGPLTSYDLKQWISASIGFFWDFPHSQLYVEPARLEGQGLLRHEQEAGGRRRRIYHLTEYGRRALRSWLDDPTADPTEIRDQGLLKLFFCTEVGRSEIRRLAVEQAAAHREKLRQYEKLDIEVAGLHRHEPQRATLRMGMEFERLAAGFWEGIAENPPEAAPQRGGAVRRKGR